METARRPTARSAGKSSGGSGARVVSGKSSAAAAGARVVSGRAPLREAEINADGRSGRVASQESASTNAKPAPRQPRASISSRQNNTTSNAASDAPRVAALARRPRVSAVAMPGTAAAAAAAVTTAPASIRVDSTSFEEWMKMATDNKINATNTWNFALIDYFHDMSLLRNDSGDGSINFQKASCTLDGCIKVWTSRVDSVVVETGRLLNGLQDDLNGGAKNKRRGGEDGEDDAEGDDLTDGEDEEGGSSGKKRKRNKAKESTIAKDFSQIQVKKLELEFTVDPLFKKTSADFDEGGAGGLLMNHLGVDHQARIVFDAGDVAGVADEEDIALDMADISADHSGDASREAGAHGTNGPASNSLVPIEMIDICALRSKLLGTASQEDEDSSLQGLLSRRTICPTFASFRFSKDDNTLFEEIAGDDDTSLDNGGLAPAASDFGGEGMWDDDMPPLDDGPSDEMDFFAGDAGGADGGDYDDMDGDEYGMPGGMNGEGAGPSNSMVPNRNGPDIFMALGNLRSAEDGEDNDGDGMFDYFDQKIMKNWAGPEHWKLRRAVPSGAASGEKDGADGTAKSARKVKEAFVIDFMDGEAPSTKELFEPAGKGVSIFLPKKSKTAKDELYLLPEDRHFSSKQLLRLFLKPRMQLNLRRRGGRVEMQDASPQEDEVEEDFWTNAAANQDPSDANNAGGFDDSMGGDSGFDAGGYDDLPPLDDDGPISFGNSEADTMVEGDSEFGSQTLKRVKPEYVNYAKKAKRVDVRKLKETIWKELAIPVPPLDGSSSDSESDDSHGPATPNGSQQGEKRVFRDVLRGLRKTYPKDKMDEISTSFCFICLLHLANEEGLKLKISQGPQAAGAGDESFASVTSAHGRLSTAPDAELSSSNIFEKMAQAGMGVKSSDEDDALGAAEGGLGELAEDAGKIGKLQWLQIEKDPNAGRSA